MSFVDNHGRILEGFSHVGVLSHGSEMLVDNLGYGRQGRMVVDREDWSVGWGSDHSFQSFISWYLLALEIAVLIIFSL